MDSYNNNFLTRVKSVVVYQVKKSFVFFFVYKIRQDFQTYVSFFFLIALRQDSF